ncbi:hypothetical protein [Streptomyces sp. NPDC003480]
MRCNGNRFLQLAAHVTSLGPKGPTDLDPWTALRPGRAQAEAAVDGWYALLTTLTPKQAGAAEVLRRHKGQQGTVERPYGDAKGPWPSPPSSCRTNKTVAALVAVICLDLLIFGLIERQVRRALGGDQKMRGLYSGTQMSAPPAGRAFALGQMSEL